MNKIVHNSIEGTEDEAFLDERWSGRWFV